MGAQTATERAGERQKVDKLALLERFRTQMLATARRYSANSHDADDAYQRAAEILLTHSPAGTDDELCRWLRTTVKHEALAIRRQVQRVTPAGEPQLVPESTVRRHESAHEEAERSERLRVGAQALGHLKPQEVRCLVLKAEGYSYQEICDRTGFSYTKVNRCLTEGRRSFLAQVASIESGAECERLAPRLSAVADGEATAADLAAVRPHLKSCLACRARLRHFRTVPARVAALVPAGALAADGRLPSPARTFLESLVGSAQHKASALGERAHQTIELAGGQKAAAVAASAAALAGGGAVTAERLSERAGDRTPAAELRQASERTRARTAAQPPVRSGELSVPSPTAAPTPPPATFGGAPEDEPPPARRSKPADEFAPQASTAAAPPPAPVAPPPPAPASEGASPAGGGDPSGEFAP